MSKRGFASSVLENSELSDKTIVLPKKIYSECIKKDQFIVVRYPVSNTNSILKLSSLNVLSWNKNYSEVSSDLAVSLGLEINGDILNIINIFALLKG